MDEWKLSLQQACPTGIASSETKVNA